MTKLKVNTGESGGYSPGSYYKESPLASVDVKSEESLEKWGRFSNSRGAIFLKL